MTPLMRKLLIWRRQENKGEKNTEVADGATHKDTEVWQLGESLKQVHSSGEGPWNNLSSVFLNFPLTWDVQSYKKKYYRWL